MKDEPVVHSEIKGWFEWAGKAILVGIVSLAVSYLKDISLHMTSLDKEITQMRTEANKNAQFQTTINDNIARQLEKIEGRLQDVEKHCCSKR